MRVACPIAEAARESPGRPALVGPEHRLSYGELNAAVEGAASRLRALGLPPGSRVALHMPTCEAYVVLLFALWRSGYTACPLSTRLLVHGIASALASIRCTTLITDGAWNEARLLRNVHGVQAATLLAEPRTPGTAAELVLNQPATIIFTSGSTGTPKAALHSLGNHIYSALGSNQNIPLGPGDGWLLSLPLYHVGGLGILFRCALAGAAVLLPGAGEPLAASISRLPLTHLSLVATQLYRLLRDGHAARLATLKAVLLGGSAIPPSLLDEAVTLGLPVHTSYGLTEMSSQVTTTRPHGSRDDLRTSGLLLSHRELRISSDGEILVRGATLFEGYVTDGEVRRPVVEEGWFATGDLGRVDERGNLTVLGRRDNLFISGGENIQPEEIERALIESAGAEEAVVVPVPDEEFGYRPAAFVRTSEASLDAGAFAAALRERLPGYMLPVAFLELPPAEEGARMKWDRAALARQAAEAVGQRMG